MLSVTAAGCAAQVPANAPAIANSAAFMSACRIFRDSPAKVLEATPIINPFISIYQSEKTITGLWSRVLRTGHCVQIEAGKSFQRNITGLPRGLPPQPREMEEKLHRKVEDRRPFPSLPFPCSNDLLPPVDLWRRGLKKWRSKIEDPPDLSPSFSPPPCQPPPCFVQEP